MPLRIPPAFHYPRFRYLWLGLMISIAGSQMQVWAIFWNIRTLTDKPIALGGIGLARLLPIVLLSLIGGTLADRVNRRNLLFITQSTMVLVALTLAALSMAGRLDLWHIYLLTAIQASTLAFDGPARQSLVPNLVPAEALPSAFSLNSIAFEIGAVVGPALSGLVIAYWGQAYTYLLNAISFLAVIVALIAIGQVPQQIVKRQGATINIADIREGISFIRNSPIILSTMILDFFATFFSSANTLMPFIARDVLHVGPVAYGWLSSAQSIGAVVASVTISQYTRIRRQGPVLLTAVLIFGAATIVFGLFAKLPLDHAGVDCHRRRGCGQHSHPQYRPPASNPRLHPRPDDLDQSDLLYGRSAAG